MSKYFKELIDSRSVEGIKSTIARMDFCIDDLEKENYQYKQELEKAKKQLEEIKSDLHRFIYELAWQDVKYDAMQSTMGEFAGSTLAIPRYSIRYYDLWKEISEIKLDKIKEGE